MKKIQKLFILLMTVVLIGGCTVHGEYNITINSDKSIDFATVAAMDEEMIQAFAAQQAEQEESTAESTVIEETTDGTTDSTQTDGTTDNTDDETDATIDGTTDTTDSTQTDGTTDSVADATTEVTDESTVTEEAEEDEPIRLTDEEKWAIVAQVISEEKRSEFADAGYVIEEYDQNGYKGYRFTKTFDSIDDFTYGDLIFGYTEENITYGTLEESTDEATTDTTSEEETGDTSVSYQSVLEELTSDDLEQKIFTQNGLKYTANIPFTMSSEESDLSAVYEVQLVVTLPNEAISHNATSVSDDGKTLTWNLLGANSDETVEFEFSFINKYVILGAIAGIALILLIIIILIIRKIVKHKKNKKALKNKEASGADTVPNTVDVMPGVDNMQNTVTPTPVATPSEVVSPVTPTEPVTPVATVPEASVDVPNETPSNVRVEPVNNTESGLTTGQSQTETTTNETAKKTEQPSLAQPLNSNNFDDIEKL